MSWDQLLATLHTTRSDGLSSADAAERLAKTGPNEVKGRGGPSVWRILARHTFNFFQGTLMMLYLSYVVTAVVLGVALVISLAIQEWIDAGVVGVLIVVNILVGFFQEYRAEQTLHKLRQLSAPTVTVLRDGRVQELSTAQLVPGDVLLFNAGDRIAADVRVFEVAEFETDEALLTGESAPVEKTDAIPDAGVDTPLAERSNCAFMGTACVRGAAKGVVVNTGQQTELGRIAESLRKSKKETTLLQKRLDRLGQVVVVGAVICCGLVLLTGHFWGTFDDILSDGLVTAVSTAVSIIPESLLPVLTLSLTLGVRRLARHNAIIRRLGAIESLGNITHICADKTGTLTLGRMSAAQLRLEGTEQLLFQGVESNDPTQGSLQLPNGASPPEGNAVLRRALQVLSLCTAASLEQDADGKWLASGSPTDVALLVAAHRAGAAPASFRARTLRVLPFDSAVKRMSIVVHVEGEAAPVLLSKGAPEQVLRVCSQLPDGTALTDERKVQLTAENEGVAAEGLRVLGLAWRTSSESEIELPRDQLVTGLTWLGLVALADPPRASVPTAVADCQRAGIVVHMATGDQSATARAIAIAVGILPADAPPQLTSAAADFDARTEDDPSALPLVISRCTPQSKVRLIKELHKRKGYVAMTGDGVNDAPALAGADVGVAMSNASDVAKEAADMVLTEDDFGVIVRAIEEGRRIFANIRKFIILYLAGNVGEVVVLVLGICFGLPPPLLPIQILWVNLITGTPPAMALAAQPFRPELMDKQVRPPGEGLWNAETLVDIFVYGILLGTADLAVFVLLRFVFDESLPQCQAAAFAGLTVLLALHAYNALHQRNSFISRELVTVKEVWILHATVWLSIGSLFLTFYIEWIRKNIFKQAKPTLIGWSLVVGFSILFLATAELYKLIKRIWFRRTARRRDAQHSNVELGVIAHPMPAANNAAAIVT